MAKFCDLGLPRVSTRGIALAAVAATLNSAPVRAQFLCGEATQVFVPSLGGGGQSIGGCSIGSGSTSPTAGVGGLGIQPANFVFLARDYSYTGAIGATGIGYGTLSVIETTIINNGTGYTTKNVTGIGNYATAVGAGASAGFSGSAAFGSGATATAANQQVFGTATNTYSMPGIASASSATRQIGPTQFVTTDANGNLAIANGNLATDGGATYAAIAVTQTMAAGALQRNGGTMTGTLNMGGNAITNVAGPSAPADAANKAYVDAVGASVQSSFQNQINDLYARDRRLTQGIAMSAAVPHSFLMPGKIFVLNVDWANYAGANAMGLGSALRVGRFDFGNTKLDIQANMGIGFGVSGGSQAVSRAGLRMEW